MSLAISTAKADITPPPGTPLAGFGEDSPRLTTGATAPLYARCVILWDSGWPNVIVTCDTLAIPRAVNLALRAQIEPLGPPGTPIGHEDLAITATHTHNGGALTGELDPYIAYNVTPGSAADGAIQAYTAQLQASVVGCVQAALGAPQTPCTLDYQVTTQNFAYNREGLPYTETAVPVLAARDASTGALLALLFSYGAHPVAGGPQTVSDPDYPGAACAWIEAQHPGVFAQFLLGPAGDQDPNGTSWSLGYAQSLGQGLGAAVLTAAGSPGRTVSGPIGTAYQDLTIPLDISTTASNLAAVRADYVVREGNMSLPSWYRRHAQQMIGQIDAKSFARSVNLPVQVWTLQGATPLYLALTGGELVSGYAVYLRGLHGGPQGIWVCGYANEDPAYIPSNELLTSGGALHYACGWDTDYPGIAGGAMTVYGCLGHFKVPPCSASVDVEQILLGALAGML